MSKKIATSLTAAAQQLATVAATLQQAAAALSGAAAPVAAAPAAPRFTSEEVKKMKSWKNAFLELGESPEAAHQKAIAKLESMKKGKKNSGAAVAAPVDQPAPRQRRAAAPAPAAQKKIKMLTLEDVRNGTAMSLAEFGKSLVEEHGIDRNSEKFAALRAQFMELRKKYKAQLDEEASVAASGEDLVDGMTVDDGTVEFAEDDGGYEFDAEPVVTPARGKKKAAAIVDADDEFN